VEIGDEAMAELSTQQVKLMRKTWEVIKESYEIHEESQEKIPIIEGRIEEMEKKCEKIKKLMEAYNGKYANDEKAKLTILNNIKSFFEQVRTEYIQTRSELNSLKMAIEGNLVKLDLMNDQQTDMLIQNVSLSVITLLQAFTGKFSPASIVQNAATSAKNITQNLQAKGAISQAKYDLNVLKGKIDELEKRLSAIKKVKEEAEEFLKEHGQTVN